MTSLAPALMTTPLMPEEVAMPARSLGLLMLIDLVMVTEPKSPGSRTSISPPAIVCANAAAKVRQGEEPEHGLESLPDVAETHVRADCVPLEDEKVAATLSTAFTVAEHPPDPLHAPVQPLK